MYKTYYITWCLEDWNHLWPSHTSSEVFHTLYSSTHSGLPGERVRDRCYSSFHRKMFNTNLNTEQVLVLSPQLGHLLSIFIKKSKWNNEESSKVELLTINRWSKDCENLLWNQRKTAALLNISLIEFASSPAETDHLLVQSLLLHDHVIVSCPEIFSLLREHGSIFHIMK